MEMDLISTTLHHIGQNFTNTFVIQIGAMDGIAFDDTRGFLDTYNWDALLVEPIPVLFDELKQNFKHKNNYIFEQSAIAEYDGIVRMLTVPPDIIEKEQLHPGYKGMSALYPLKNGFGSNYQRDIDVKENFATVVRVPSLTFESLLKKHNISNFDILLCDAEGYDWNIFKQLDLKKYRPKFIRLEYINLTEDEKALTVAKLEDNGYTVSIGLDIDAVDTELWQEINKRTTTPVQNSIDTIGDIKNQIKTLSVEDKKALLEYLTKPELEITNTDLTVVTGLWDINRTGRDFSHYIENFKKFLNIPVNMFIYIPRHLEYLVWENSSRTTANTHVRVFELTDIKNTLYSPFWDKTQEIRTSPEWYNKTGVNGWLTNSPQATLEYYNPIVQSKMFMLHDAKIMNVFNTDYFLWLDAGITNTVSSTHLIEDRCLDKIIPLLKTFLFLSYPYEAVNEIHGFDFKTMNTITRQEVKYVCRGGLFGGHKDFISHANANYYAVLENTLNKNLMGTEESIFSIMAHLEPHIYRRYELGSHGMIGTFTQGLLDDTVKLVESNSTNLPKGIYNQGLEKTSLYVLAFNFPEQFHTLLKSFTRHPEWLEKPRKILINNSNDKAAIAEYDRLCTEYGFEHIITGENLGINRGRLYAAKHFHESDSDYYFFFEDDMCLHEPNVTTFCRNGFKQSVPNLYKTVHEIMAREGFDFLKLSYTEVYMDNNIQVSWYNVPQSVRTHHWPEYDKLPISGLDPHAPRTKFNHINMHNGLSYASGEIYYANWPMIVNKTGNYKMFLETQWAHPFEQTWMSHMFQETIKNNLNPAVLLASPINHNRIAHYSPEVRREN